MTNKRGTTIPIEFLIGIVIAILILVPTITLISRLASSPGAEDAFNRLNIFMKEFALSDSHYEPFALTKYRDNAYIFFNKKENITTLALGPGPDAVLAMERPYSCEENKSCICLCEDSSFGEPFTQEGDTLSANEGGRLDCGNTICKEGADIDIVYCSFDIYKNAFGEKQDCDGGVIIESGMLKGVPFTKKSSLYLERFGGFTGICSHYPCLPDAFKKKTNADEAFFEEDYDLAFKLYRDLTQEEITNYLKGDSEADIYYRKALSGMRKSILNDRISEGISYLDEGITKLRSKLLARRVSKVNITKYRKELEGLKEEYDCSEMDREGCLLSDSCFYKKKCSFCEDISSCSDYETKDFSVNRLQCNKDPCNIGCRWIEGGNYENKERCIKE